MKHIFNSGLALILLSAALILNSCQKRQNDPVPDEEKKCGDKKEWIKSLGMEDITYSEENGGIRTFSFENVNAPDNICTDEHIDVLYHVNLNQADTSMDWYGKTYWGGLWGSEIPLQESASTDLYFSGEDRSIGLQMAYNGGKGWVGIRVFVQFPTKGSENEDLIHMGLVLKNIGVSCEYYEYKEK